MPHFDILAAPESLRASALNWGDQFVGIGRLHLNLASVALLPIQVSQLVRQLVLVNHVVLGGEILHLDFRRPMVTN